jgi:5'(3')-deoxyribonucleotidase
MRIRDLFLEDGRIVKGVNTTPDVDVNSISKEAGKFGNKVDKDGRPPTHSKKVKGKSTNVLFNLGMVNESKEFEEAMGEIASATEIYVDMDGVIADFFGEWAKLMGVDHFSDIKDAQPALQKIRDTDDFWLRLPVLPEAKNLLNLIKEVKGEYSICTSPLADDPNSEKHKRTWVEKNLAFFPPKAVHVTHNKPQFATAKDGTPNILIDDYGVNINAWEAAGGIGFKYKDHKFERTAKTIKQHLDVEEGTMLANPKNTFVTKSDTAYDFIKVGTNLANLKDVPAGANVDEPDIMIAPYAGAKEMKYLMKQLNRIGYKTQDASGYQDAHYDETPTGGEAPPQMKAQGPLGKIKISKLRGVQKERTYEKLAKQLENVLEGDYAPLQIDRKGRVINGHHRLDALRLVGEEYARVYMIDDIVENVKETYADDQREKTKRTLAKHEKAMIKVARDSIKKYEKDKEDKETNENFADGKKKGKSRPGRVKKSGASCNGSVTELRKKAKNASGERAKMYHWCANMKSGK